MNDTQSRDPLDALVFQYLERVEAGESGQVVLTELCEEHPEQSPALRRGVGLLRDVRLHPGAAEDGLPDRVGPFRLLRRLGAGGMGVVYLAEQSKPTRRVALKLVRPDQLWFDGYRERFTREIESAGRLAHPGIAPVYEMGEHDGVPWFSQEYVVGAPLSALLANVPARSPETLTGSDLRASLEDALEEEVQDSAWDEEFFRGSWTDICLQIGRQVADALQHAHERGVLHRDVKPSNILLTPGGRAVLVDFGLASLQGTERLTQTGAQIGSLHYMPPEQVDGRVRDIGARSDVYSLGVTLYEFLTLRAPYASQSVQRLRGMILAGEAPEARSCNHAVSRDVNIVVGCAMDPSPARRYSTASDFSADLTAARTHRPISARQASPGQKLLRWVRRHPTTAIGSAAGFLLLVVAPLLFGLQSYRAADQQRELNDALNANLNERDALLGATLDGFQDVVRWTAHETLRDVPGFQQERLKLIDKSLAIFARVREARPDDLAVQLQQALMQRTRGDILILLGRRAEARVALEQAALTFEARTTGPQANVDLLRQLASLRHQQARNEQSQGLLEDALNFNFAAVEAQRRAALAGPEDSRNHIDLSRTCSMLANELFSNEGPSSQAMELMSEAIEASRRAATMDPGSPGVAHSLYEALWTRAKWRETEGRNREALADHREALTFIERALALDPQDRGIRVQQVHALTRMAHLVLMIEDDATASIALLEYGLELCDSLIDEYPSIPLHVEKRLELLGGLGPAYRAADQFARSREIEEEIVSTRLARLAQEPKNSRESINVAIAIHNLTNSIFFDESLGPERLDRVLELCDQAEALIEPYALSNPRARKARQVRMLLHYKRGAVFNQLEMPEDLLAETEALRDLDLDVPVKYMLTAKLYAHWANRADDSKGRVKSLEQAELAVSKGYEDLVDWERGELELELAEYPRIRELGEIVRERAATH